MQLAGRNALVTGATPGIRAAVPPGAATPTTVTIGTEERFRDRCLDRNPMGSRAGPDMLAPPFVFLAAAGASYSTGQVIAADGGMTMR